MATQAQAAAERIALEVAEKRREVTEETDILRAQTVGELAQFRRDEETAIAALRTLAEDYARELRESIDAAKREFTL
ncbi:hypothetical protein H9X75_10220, partial [Fusobacterium mortiferum]|uniref:hypothetical protein n=1 Tax=Fusobacterium mortiferum TaxID=850 RepID=UPI00195BE930|nr:hypothetical protein [Fusobacterium mortiferum]